ncbi:MAG TPA: hypothetical protein VGR19_12835 [Allosphingosinicella sp.]|nr:hypothetical protein [Allosphingosinicella sp.]
MGNGEIRLVRAYLGLVLCGLTIGCDWLNPSTLVIQNGGSVTAKGVVVSTDRGDRWELGDIPAGEMKRFSASIEGEGGLDLSFSYQGKRIKAPGCYYTSGGLNPAKGKVTIKNEHIRMDCTSG